MESAAWEALIQRVRDQKLPSAIIYMGRIYPIYQLELMNMLL